MNRNDVITALAGCHVDSVTQGFNLSGICDSLEALVKSEKLRRADNNDLLKIHFMDAALQVESNNSAHTRKRLVKLSSKAHVDGMAAVLDALCMSQVHRNDLLVDQKNDESGNTLP